MRERERDTHTHTHTHTHIHTHTSATRFHYDRVDKRASERRTSHANGIVQLFFVSAKCFVVVRGGASTRFSHSLPGSWSVGWRLGGAKSITELRGPGPRSGAKGWSALGPRTVDTVIKTYMKAAKRKKCTRCSSYSRCRNAPWKRLSEHSSSLATRDDDVHGACCCCSAAQFFWHVRREGMVELAGPHRCWNDEGVQNPIFVSQSLLQFVASCFLVPVLLAKN